jgi:hypothetical protein
VSRKSACKFEELGKKPGLLEIFGGIEIATYKNY